MTIETLPFEHRPRNSIANNLDKINELVDWVNELVDWVNLDTHLYASASGERVTVDDTSSLKGLTVDGRSVQDGTPSPDAPVAVQVVEGRNLDDCIVLDVKSRNLTPWFSAGCTVPDAAGYWHTLLSPNYTSGTEDSSNEGRKVITAMDDGWAHVIIDSRPSAGNDGKSAFINTWVNLGKLADIVPGATYTWLAEVRNMTWIGATDNDKLTVAPSAGDATRDKLSTSNVAAMKTKADAVMKTIVVAKNDLSRVTRDTRGYMFIPTGCYAEFDVRVSLYAGEYTGSYIPYAMPVPPIDLHGNTLASLPDGTRDELHVDSAGRVWIEKRTGRILTPTDVSNVNNMTQVTGGARWNIDVDGLASEEIPNGSTNGYCSHTPFSHTLALGSLGSHVFTFGGKVYYVVEGDFTASTAVTWVNSHQMTIIYPLATPQTIDLGYIDPPAIPSGSVVTVSASLTPTFNLEWWVDDGITELVNDLIAYIDYKTEG